MSAKRATRQDYVREALDEAFGGQKLMSSGASSIDEISSFCSNPAEYKWEYLGRKEMLIPYNSDAAPVDSVQHKMESGFPHTSKLRWEKHRVWIVEGTLRRGESNVLGRRRFYLDEDSWLILLGDGYDCAGTLVKCYILYKPAALSISKRGRWFAM